MRNGVPAQASTNTASKPFSRKQTEPTLRHDEIGHWHRAKFSLFFLFQDSFTKILNFHAVKIFQNRVKAKNLFKIFLLIPLVLI